jgi:hypothetical protein
MCVYTMCSKMNCFFFSPFFTPFKMGISSLHNFLFFFLLAVKWKSKIFFFFFKLYFFTCVLHTKTIHNTQEGKKWEEKFSNKAKVTYFLHESSKSRAQFCSHRKWGPRHYLQGPTAAFVTLPFFFFFL